MTTLTPTRNRNSTSPEWTSTTATIDSADADSTRWGDGDSRSGVTPMPGSGLGSKPPTRVLRSVDLLRPGPADWRADVLRHFLIGLTSTMAYLLLFVALRGGLSALTANVAALVVTSLTTFWVHERHSARSGSGASVRRQRLEALIASLVALVLTSGSLAAAGILTTTPSLLTELAVVTLANLPASLLRLVLLTNHRLELSAAQAT